MASSAYPLDRGPLFAVAALLCVILSACSGSSESSRVPESAAAAVDSPAQLATFAGPATAASPDFPMAPRAVAPVRRDAVYVVTATNLMDWAEIHYPQFFPSHRTDQSFAPYVYRYYPETGNYLGVDAQVIRVMGSSFGASPITVGELAQFTCNVFPESCSPTGGNCTPSVTQAFAANIEVVQANSGTYDGSGGGDGGSGGDGGGAGAGGGLGKVLGATITVIDLSDGSAVGAAVTDGVNGLVTVRTCAKPGPFLLTLEGRAGAMYYDEGRNEYLPFEPPNVLHALVDQWDEHVGVSPLTEAAYRYALNNFKADPTAIAAGRSTLLDTGNLQGLSAAQVRQANERVMAEVNVRLPTNYQVTSAKALPTPIDSASTATALQDNRYGRSAAANGGLVKAANDFNPGTMAPAIALARDLARDLTDGRIDGFALDGTAIAQADKLTYENGRLPLAGTIGANAVSTRYSAGALLPQQLRVEETAWVGAGDGSSCDSFRDDVALLTDGSVTVRRRAPTNVNGKCSFTYDQAENNRVVQMNRFLTGVKALGRNGKIGFAVKTDGTVVGWGQNDCGNLSPALANGYYREPVTIPGLSNITSISSLSVAVARDSSGRVYYWGFKGGISSLDPNVPEGTAICAQNTLYVNGTPWHSLQYTTVRTAEIQNVSEVYAFGSTYFALTTAGDLYGWGLGFGGLLANSNGEMFGTATLAPGLVGADVETPTRIDGLTRVREVMTNNGSTVFALQADGNVLAWGSDTQKLLGRGTQAPALRPARVPELTDIVHMAASFNGLRFLRRDGTVLAWGQLELPAGGFSLLLAPSVVPTTGRVRYIQGAFTNFAFFLESGKVTPDANVDFDFNTLYR
jgi:hypothetical protein